MVYTMQCTWDATSEHGVAGCLATEGMHGHNNLQITTLAQNIVLIKQEAQGPWRSAWTEDQVHKNVLKSCK